MEVEKLEAVTAQALSNEGSSYPLTGKAELVATRMAFVTTKDGGLVGSLNLSRNVKAEFEKGTLVPDDQAAVVGGTDSPLVGHLLESYVTVDVMKDVWVNGGGDAAVFDGLKSAVESEVKHNPESAMRGFDIAPAIDYTNAKDAVSEFEHQVDANHGRVQFAGYEMPAFQAELYDGGGYAKVRFDSIEPSEIEQPLGFADGHEIRQIQNAVFIAQESIADRIEEHEAQLSGKARVEEVADLEP